MARINIGPNYKSALCEELGFDPNQTLSLTVELAKDGGVYVHTTTLAPESTTEAMREFVRHFYLQEFELVEKTDGKDTG